MLPAETPVAALPENILRDLQKKGRPHIWKLALCRSDMQSAAALHARLIRHHTAAQGYETCDCWYEGDRDAAANDSVKAKE